MGDVLIFQKDVDLSVLRQGVSFPVKYQQRFYDLIGFRLRKGDSRGVTIIIDNEEYSVRVSNLDFDEEKYPGRSDIVQLRYDPNSEIAEKLRSIFESTTQLLRMEESKLSVGGLSKRMHLSIPEDRLEKLNIYSTGENSVLRFVCHPLKSTSLGLSKRYWIFPCNVKKYDAISAFDTLHELDWSQSVKCNPGDEVFLYCGAPYSKIVFRCVIIKSGISSEDRILDKQFWVDSTDYDKETKYGYARLRLLSATYSDALSLALLKAHGLKTAPVGPLTVKAELLEYTLSGFKTQYLPDSYPEEIIEDAGLYVEGSVKQITVNAYERNTQARKKCLAIHGTKCSICGFDFGSFYGDNFQGLINVHHKNPIHEIGSSYEVNPETDLIPVCPNCHLALHSKKDGTYTSEELTDMIKRQKY